MYIKKMYRKDASEEFDRDLSDILLDLETFIIMILFKYTNAHIFYYLRLHSRNC